MALEKVKFAASPRLSRLYRTSQLYGSGRLIRRHLGLPDDEPLPLAIPHGVDTSVSRLPMDVNDAAPVYLAWQEREARRAAKFKPVLRFPHPFLFTIPENPEPTGQGTLFLAPPPSARAFEALHAAIVKADFPRPWAILVKQRRVRKDDFAWWQARGFTTLTAGDIRDGAFYYNLRDRIAPYRLVASPNISSAAIFAVAMGKQAVPICDVELTTIVMPPVDEVLDLEDRNGEIRRIWLNLFSIDPGTAYAQARELLGQTFMASKRELRERYFDAVACAPAPLYIHEVRNAALVRICCSLAEAGVPLYKAAPHPLRITANKLRYLAGLNQLDVLHGSELSHYGIAGTPKPYILCRYRARELGRSVQPGDALRIEELRGVHFERAAIRYAEPMRNGTNANNESRRAPADAV